MQNEIINSYYNNIVKIIQPHVRGDFKKIRIEFCYNDKQTYTKLFGIYNNSHEKLLHIDEMDDFVDEFEENELLKIPENFTELRKIMILQNNQWNKCTFVIDENSKFDVSYESHYNPRIVEYRQNKTITLPSSELMRLWHELKPLPIIERSTDEIDHDILSCTSLLSELISKHLPKEIIWRQPMAEQELELKKFELEIGRRLPQDFRRFYLLHDSHDNKNRKKYAEYIGIIYCWQLLALKDSISAWEDWACFEKDWDDNCQFSKCMAGKKIKEKYVNRGWIPFAEDCGGNYLGIDLDPDINGTYGQVINFGRNEDNKYVLADSFLGFLKWYVLQLQNKNFIAKGDEDDYEFGAKEHEFF
ncbi:MAG: hypothetical protein DCC88_03255 [Spirobacillus cienkowskii]|jgi:cell wall assembly regulator SMI1|uniref:Knr4/Smi1-like domain-containing protein n=1 Tax=Spirobacillus cienkowskii TaxID=495820 RepID=A0A369KYJ7_9BACT|nr:MAG: hypothetical protein DCC88_03255 [Spirobacillus cienkowskii]